MTTASLKARIDAETDGLNQSIESNASKDDNTEETVTPMDTTSDETDEIPWSSLASFALYKLFLEWHNQGTSVPVPRPGLPSPVKGIKRENVNTPKTPVQKELPPNATNIHPVMLLNQMRPGLTYVELNRVGNPPNTMFTLAVDVDGVEYTGTGIILYVFPTETNFQLKFKHVIMYFIYFKLREKYNEYLCRNYFIL